ncbi:MAG: Lrp/AsnC family transcriptional regulator [Ilumatobacter sp.]|uniref:Lrp/AsnC family transcriptional regulator n=1 Tax=Ilumatobacter sp. TaxID=1967498 RepID=UPI003919E4B5
MANIDAKHLEILRHLQSDARCSNRALATAIDMSPSSTLERVRDLERGGVIVGYHAEIDPSALGRQIEALISVRVVPKTRDRVAAVVDAIYSMRETVSVSLMSGDIDLIVHVSVPDTASLRAIVVDQIAELPGVVDERTSIMFEHRRKHVLDPL